MNGNIDNLSKNEYIIKKVHDKDNSQGSKELGDNA